MALVVKNYIAITRDITDTGLNLGWEDPLEGHGSPLVFLLGESPLDRGVWGATVMGSLKSDTTEAA